MLASLLFSTLTNAAPQKIEMIFLSPQKITLLLEQIEKFNSSKRIGTLSQNDSTYADDCVPMGDGCFHPKYGYLERKPVANNTKGAILTDPSKTKTEEVAIPKDPELQLKTFNALETNLINCDKNNYFDIFCGKEKPASKPAEIEIWFDVSSSLRTVDYNKDPDQCARRTFMTKVKAGCNDKVRVSIYNTSLKEAGDSASVCLSYGTNDESKLLQWLKDSQAKTLLIVTDVDEMSTALRDFLDQRGAKMIGDGVNPFTSADLVKYANDFVKTCKK